MSDGLSDILGGFGFLAFAAFGIWLERIFKDRWVAKKGSGYLASLVFVPFGILAIIRGFYHLFVKSR